jgi:hypothetical protein
LEDFATAFIYTVKTFFLHTQNPEIPEKSFDPEKTYGPHAKTLEKVRAVFHCMSGFT